MEFYDDLVDFLNNLDDFFIEVEGRPGKLEKYIEKYNSVMDRPISMSTDGVCVLNDSDDKWGLEFRLYANERPQPPLHKKFRRNHTYRPEYKYRFNSNKAIKQLLSDGFNLGYNKGVI